MPSFLIVGVQKGGTTSLYDHLVQHPDVLPAERKEIHFFDFNRSRGAGWYASFFATRCNSGDQITGEATPSYFFLEDVPREIRSVLPEVKIIILLRDPTSRAISHYSMERFRGTEKLPLADAIQQERKRVSSGRHARVQFSYIDQGLYRKHLESWFQHFPQDQVLCLKSEDFFRDPQSVTNRVFEFLSLAPETEIDYRVQNRAAERVEISDAEHNLLSATFEGPNSELIDLLGENFSW